MEETTTTTSSILLMAKIGAMIGLGFGSLTLGMLPLMVGRCRTKFRQKRCHGITSNSSNSTSTSTSASRASSTIADNATNSQGLLTSLLLCFGGGVLLFTTFLHLAPEVRLSVERHQSNGQLPTLGTLSLSELLFCGGFFLVYLVEEAVHAALTGKPESSEALLYRTVSVRRCNNQTGVANTTSATSGSTTTVSTTTRSTWKDDSEAELRQDDEKLDGRSRHHRLVDMCGVKDDKVLPAIFVLSASAEIGSADHRHHHHRVGGGDVDEDDVDEKRHRSDPELAGYAARDDHNHQHKHAILTKKTSVQGLLTVLALSFHAIFEGLAVGLEPSFGSVVYLAAAIATHKLVISFCVGMELYVAGASTRTTLGYLTVFSMVTPIGIAVGLALGHFKNDSDTLGPTPTILQGMAAGTLLYVVFFEVLARERANEKSGLLQLLAIIVGFMLMLGLQIATAHSHSHSHSHSHLHSHSHGANESHDDEHDHEEDGHDHGFGGKMDHSHEASTQKVVGDAIERVTQNIVDVLSQSLASSTSPRPQEHLHRDHLSLATSTDRTA